MSLSFSTQTEMFLYVVYCYLGTCIHQWTTKHLSSIKHAFIINNEWCMSLTLNSSLVAHHLQIPESAYRTIIVKTYSLAWSVVKMKNME